MSTPDSKTTPKKTNLKSSLAANGSPRSPQKTDMKTSRKCLNNSFSKSISINDLDGSPAGDLERSTRRTLWEPPAELFPQTLASSDDTKCPIVYFPCELTANDYARRVLDIVAADIQKNVLAITQGSVVEKSDGILESLSEADQGDVFCLLEHIIGSKHSARGNTDDALEVLQCMSTSLGVSGKDAPAKLGAAGQALLAYKPLLGCLSTPLDSSHVEALLVQAKHLLALVGDTETPRLEALSRQHKVHMKFQERRAMALGLCSATKEDSFSPKKADSDKSSSQAQKSKEDVGEPSCTSGAVGASSDASSGGAVADVIARGEELLTAMVTLDETPQRSLTLLLTRLKVLRDEVALLLLGHNDSKHYDNAQLCHDLVRGYISPAIASTDSAVTAAAASGAAASSSGEVDAMCAAASAMMMAARTEQSAAEARGEFTGPASAAALDDLLTRLASANNQLTTVDHESPVLLDPTNKERCGDFARFLTSRNLLALRHPVDGLSIMALLVAAKNEPLQKEISKLWNPGFGTVVVEDPRSDSNSTAEGREASEPDGETEGKDTGAETDTGIGAAQEVEAVSESRHDALAHFLRVSGYSATELKIAGYSCRDAAAAGFTCREVYDAGFRQDELKEGGFSCRDFKGIGFSARKVRALGYSAKDANEAGFSCKDIYAAGYSGKEARRAGFNKLRDLRVAGYWCKSARDTCKEAKDAGYYDPRDMKVAGFSCQDARDAGYKWNDCVVAGYSYEEAVETGFPYTPAAFYSAAYWNDHYTKFVDIKEEVKAAERAKHA